VVDDWKISQSSHSGFKYRFDGPGYEEENSDIGKLLKSNPLYTLGKLRDWFASLDSSIDCTTSEFCKIFRPSGLADTGIEVREILRDRYQD